MLIYVRTGVAPGDLASSEDPTGHSPVPGRTPYNLHPETLLLPETLKSLRWSRHPIYYHRCYRHGSPSSQPRSAFVRLANGKRAFGSDRSVVCSPTARRVPSSQRKGGPSKKTFSSLSRPRGSPGLGWWWSEAPANARDAGGHVSRRMSADR